MSNVNMFAGASRGYISPPVGIPMEGFAGRGPLQAVHDELTATALVLQASGSAGIEPRRIALVCCDLVSIPDEQVAKIKVAINDLTGIKIEGILISSSHNHFGPMTDAAGGGLAAGESAPQVSPYLDNLSHLVAGLVKMAADSSEPCRVYYGEGAARIGINRRERLPDGQIVLGQNPAGPVDSRVALLRIDKATGQPLAAILNYACHVVSLGSDCTHLTADFPGVARRVFEESTGAMCMFLQGAAGDINPLLMGLDWSYPDRLGLPLGAEAVRVFGQCQEVDLSAGISIARETLQLPAVLPVSEKSAHAQMEQMKGEEQAALEAGEEADLYWVRSRMQRIARGLRVLTGEETASSVAAEVVAIGLGTEVAVITAPGEIFNEIGSRIISQSPFAHTLYAGYTNGSIDYVPTREAYAEGGYEVTH